MFATNNPENKYSKVTFIIIFILVIVLSYKILESFLIAVSMGCLLAYTLKPIMRYRPFKKLKPTHAASLIVLGLIIVIVIPLGFFVASFIRQAILLENYLASHETVSIQSMISTISRWPLMKHFVSDSTQLQEQINTWSSNLMKTISSMAINQAGEIPSLLIQTIFILMSCLVFLTEGERFASWLSDKIPLNSEIKKSLSQSFGQSSKRAVWASLSASGAQALTIFTAFLTLNVPAAVLATGATFIFAFIPFLGSSPVWILGAIYLYMQGSFVKFAFMIVFGLMAGVMDNIVRALILKGPHGLHPLVGLIAVFGGIKVFGIFGVLIGPMVAALLIALCEVWPQVWEK
ncbi:MAG: AI-2E family transporter [Bacteriovorax sp.]